MNKEERKAIEDMNRFANGIDMSCVTARQMQIILNLIEKLQKENEELKENNKIVSDLYWDECIPKQIIKDKIENLKKVKERNIKRNFDTVYKDGYFTGGIDALQELL